MDNGLKVWNYTIKIKTQTKGVKPSQAKSRRKRGTLSEICIVQNKVKKPNDLSTTGGNGEAKAGNETKASSE